MRGTRRFLTACCSTWGRRSFESVPIPRRLLVGRDETMTGLGRFGPTGWGRRFCSASGLDVRLLHSYNSRSAAPPFRWAARNTGAVSGPAVNRRRAVSSQALARYRLVRGTGGLQASKPPSASATVATHSAPASPASRWTVAELRDSRRTAGGCSSRRQCLCFTCGRCSERTPIRAWRGADLVAEAATQIDRRAQPYSDRDGIDR